MNLKSDIEKYKEVSLPGFEELKSFYQNMTLLDAIIQASKGINPKGKMDRHMYHIGYKDCGKGAENLSKNISAVQKCRNFRELFLITEQEKSKIPGLGNLWSYDTALRIGFNLRLYPEEVYVHAGVIKGVKKALDGIKPTGRSIDLKDLPLEIQTLNPYEVENFLCIWGKKK